MGPTDALTLLDQAVAQINASRQLHVQLQQAIECLRASINSPLVEQPIMEHSNGENKEQADVES